MQEIWKYQFANELKILPDSAPILLSEPPLNPLRNREKMAEIMFETFQTPALYLSLQPVLAFYASSKGLGIVLDSGEQTTHIVPIFEGFALRHGIQRLDIGGSDLNRYLMKCLHESGLPAVASAEIKDIKEKLCYVATDVNNETEQFARYVLPDQQVLQIGSPRFKTPEALFRPSLLGMEAPGIHEIINDSINKCDMDIHKTMYANIVLAGGSTLFPGLCDRLAAEMKSIAPSQMRAKVVAPPERKYSSWIGGSILASLSFFEQIWVSKSEFQECGVCIVNRKCF